MTGHFNVELSMREAPARAATTLSPPARAIGLRLTKRAPGQLCYRPSVQIPLLIILWHYMNRERMTVKCDPSATGRTRVTSTGTVARSKRELAADPEHWPEALGATPTV